MRAPEIIAAGAVLWRQAEDTVELALIHRPKYDDWSFPKGKLKKGESLLQAARREVCEETGIIPVLGRPLAPSFYYKSGRLKRVDYWAATATDNQVQAVMDAAEVDRLEWVPMEEAAERLTHERDLPVLRDFAEGPLQTVPLVLVRHGAGIAKKDWPDADELRPLNYQGRARATELAEQLVNFAPSRAYSATSARCLQTLLPLAVAEGIELTAIAELTEDPTKTGAVAQRCHEELAKGVSTVVCGRGDSMSDLLRHLCDLLGVAVPVEAPLERGDCWIVHTAEGRFVAIEHHPA